MAEQAATEDATEEWCVALPKVELHAHLHGSIRDPTVRRLLENKLSCLSLCCDAGGELKETDLAQAKAVYDALSKDAHTFKAGDRSLQECFTVFKLLHSVVDNLDVVAAITAEVIRDFAGDNVKYLELRTTPRACPATFTLAGDDDDDKHDGLPRARLKPATSKEDYVRVVLQEIARCQEEGVDVVVRLLLSVDRSASVEEALDTVQLAQRYMDRGVVGVDFSGNPTGTPFASFLRVFETAREAGLKITVHCAEIDRPEETSLIIKQFVPDRLGHAVVLQRSMIEHLLEHPIPIEICPTSNLKTLAVGDLRDHPFGDFYYAADYPLSISTDDSGVFNTTLSHEYFLMAQAFDVPRRRMFDMALRAVDCIFEGQEVRDKLRARFELARAELLGETET